MAYLKNDISLAHDQGYPNVKLLYANAFWLFLNYILTEFQELIIPFQETKAQD